MHDERPEVAEHALALQQVELATTNVNICIYYIYVFTILSSVERKSVPRNVPLAFLRLHQITLQIHLFFCLFFSEHETVILLRYLEIEKRRFFFFQSFPIDLEGCILIINIYSVSSIKMTAHALIRSLETRIIRKIDLLQPVTKF